jgi:hypothetical protein
VAEFRELTVSTYSDAMKQLKPGETLVATHAPGMSPTGDGHIPVTSDRSFRIQTEMGGGTIYARKD